jgi:hypothetical protein
MNLAALLDDNLFYHLKQQHFHCHTMLVLLEMAVVKRR